MFTKPHTHQVDIVNKLGLQMKPDGTLVTDMVCASCDVYRCIPCCSLFELVLSQFCKTSMDGVFAGGDNMDWRQQLSVAIGNGG